MKTNILNYYSNIGNIKSITAKFFFFILLFSTTELILAQNDNIPFDSTYIGITPKAGDYTGDNFWLTKGGGMTGMFGPARVSLFGESWSWEIGFVLDKRWERNAEFIIKRPTYNVSYPLFYSPFTTARIVGQGDLEFAGGGKGVSNGADAPHMIIKAVGRVGIGTSDPAERFDLYGTFRSQLSFKDTPGIFKIRAGSNNDRFWVGSESNHRLTIGSYNKGIISLYPEGYAVIYRGGTNESETTIINQANKNKYALFVTGGILSEDYSIGPKSSWADHVFNKDYKLMDLNEVESFINLNNRLPDIPSASEVEAEGYSLHDLNVKLLQKVEELTLYSIQQNKEIEQLRKDAEFYKSILEKVENLEKKIK